MPTYATDVVAGAPNPATQVSPDYKPPFVGAARAFTQLQLGGPCTEQDSQVTATNTAAIFLQGNADRVGLLMINLGANDVYLSLTSSVSTTQGIKLPQSGGNVSMNVRDDFTLPSRTFYGITNAATSAVYVLEIIRADTTIPGGL